MPAPFPGSLTILFFFPLTVPLLFYLITLVILSTTTSIIVLNGTFAKAPIITQPTTLNTVLVALAMPAYFPVTNSTFNNVHNSINRRERHRRTINGNIKGRKNHRRRPTSHTVETCSHKTPPSPSPNWPISIPLSDVESNSEEKRLKKKTWNKNIKLYKILVFIREYYEYKDEYRLNNKRKFWFIIDNLLN